MPLLVKIWAAVLGLVVLADLSVVEAATVAALASVLNTWLLLRHDGKQEQLRRELVQARRELRANRQAIRGDDGHDVIVIDPELVRQVADEVEHGDR